MNPETVRNQKAKNQAIIERKLAELAPAWRGPLSRFLTQRTSRGVRSNTRRLYATWVADLAHHVGDRAPPALTVDDVFEWLASLALRGYSYDSCRSARSYVKAFLRFVLERPDLGYALNEAFRQRSSHPPERQPLSEAECERLLQSTGNLRDQAILALFVELGLRLGELLSLRVGGVEPSEEGEAWIRLPDNLDEGLKTGPRRLYLVAYASLLHTWLSVHPRRKDPEAPLFCTWSDKSNGHELHPKSCWHLVRLAGRRAGIERTVHPHLLRHTSATRFAEGGANEADLRDRYGWGPNSRMPAHYVHARDSRRVDVARRAAGIDRAGRDIAPAQGPGPTADPLAAEVQALRGQLADVLAALRQDADRKTKS